MSVSEPGKIITPWAESGLKNTIPPAANPATGRAGFDQGFSAINMTAKEAGGIPPFGQDFNGIFYEVTNILRYMQAGGRPTFSAALAANIGGYPRGAIVLGDNGVAVYTNRLDGNASNPNSGGSGWAREDLILREALRRSYAEAGYNLVDGSFEAGGTLTSPSDVLLHEASGKAYSGAGPFPQAVTAGTDPVSGGFTAVEIVLSTVPNYAGLRAYAGQAKSIYVTGVVGVAKPEGISGNFAVDASDTTSADNGGTIIVDALGRRWKRAFSSAVSLQWFGTKGDGVADDAAAIIAAIAYAASSGKSLYAPAATYLCSSSGIIINSPIHLFGDGQFRTIFKFPEGTGNAFAMGQGTGVAGAILEGFQITGNLGGKVGLKLGDGNINNPVRDSSFKDIRIANMSTGMNTTYAFTNSYDNVRCQSCTCPAVFGSQTNDSVFNACDFVTFTSPITFTNCEGLLFNALNIANFTSASGGFTLSQSNVVINTPYIEFASPVLAQVGTPSETIPSELRMVGGIVGAGKILVGGVNTTVSVIDSRIVGGALTVDTTDLVPVKHSNIKIQTVATKDTGTLTPVLQVDYKRPTLLAGAFGGSARTLTFERDYQVVRQTTANNGLYLTAGLVVGQQYVIEYTIRNVDSPYVAMRAGTNSLDLPVIASSAAWETRRVCFIAKDPSLRLLFEGSLQWRALRIYSEIPSNYLQIDGPEPTSAWWYSAAPTTGTWKQGDIVWNTSAVAAGTPGWMCVAAGTPGTWKAMASLGA